MWLNSLKLLARPERFELPAPRFVVWCSIQLSYGRLGCLRRRRRAAKAKRASKRFCLGGQEQISRVRGAASGAPRPSRREDASRLRACSARTVRMAEIKFRERASQILRGALLIYIEHTSLADAVASVHRLGADFLAGGIRGHDGQRSRAERTYYLSWRVESPHRSRRDVCGQWWRGRWDARRVPDAFVAERARRVAVLNQGQKRVLAPRVLANFVSLLRSERGRHGQPDQPWLRIYRDACCLRHRVVNCSVISSMILSPSSEPATAGEFLRQP